MITVSSSGTFNKTHKFFQFMKSTRPFDPLDRYGREGVRLLSSATPIDTGETANSWSYNVEHRGSRHILTWSNDNVEDGVNIAVIIQYGHGTGTGGYVQGIDYINPALRPLFDKLVEDVWREVANG
jgi:hypothetical protein